MPCILTLTNDKIHILDGTALMVFCIGVRTDLAIRSPKRCLTTAASPGDVELPSLRSMTCSWNSSVCGLNLLSVLDAFSAFEAYAPCHGVSEVHSQRRVGLSLSSSRIVTG